MQATLLLFVPPHALAAVLADAAAVLGAERRCVVARELTKVSAQQPAAPECLHARRNSTAYTACAAAVLGAKRRCVVARELTKVSAPQPAAPICRHRTAHDFVEACKYGLRRLPCWRI